MTLKKKSLPSVLLLILSTLGILIGISIAVLALISLYVFSSSYPTTADEIPVFSTSALALSISILNMPTFITSINSLKRGGVYQSLQPQFLNANFLISFWLLIIAGGYFIIHEGSRSVYLAPLTVVAVIIPIWWLIEFSRRGLPRSTKLREWGTLTIGLTVSPIVILIIEVILVVIAAIVLINALGIQSGLSNQLSSILGDVNLKRSGISEIEQILNELMKQPYISTAIFLIVGLIAPLIEETFKPLAVWFLLNRPLEEHEGFSLGLISGGAFAILESAGMVIQMDIQDWLIAIIFRTATGVLHIGLSGLVGYGLARSWHQKRFGRGILFTLSATLLHGAWNSLALLSDFSSSAISGGSGVKTSNIISILSILLMIIVFIAIIVITLKINSRIKKDIKGAIEPSS